MHIMNDEFRKTVTRFSDPEKEISPLLKLIKSKGLTEEDIIRMISDIG